jgi:hypothetical protein
VSIYPAFLERCHPLKELDKKWMATYNEREFNAGKEFCMGLFGKSCPVEKDHLKIYGIPAPKKWEAADCLVCEYFEGEKCTAKEALAKHAQLLKRGQPVLAKKACMHLSAAERRKAEAAALKKASLSAEEEKGYWLVSETYEMLWATASDLQKEDILECLVQWKVNLEKGVSPAQAQILVAEWQKQRAEFKKREAE